VVLAERAGRFLGQSVAVPLAVRGPHERGDDVQVPVLDIRSLPPEVGEPEVDVEFQEVDSSWALGHGENRRTRIGRQPLGYVAAVATLRYGPARVLSRESPEAAIELLRERGYTANEIDFESGFWMDYPWAEQFGKLARRRRIVLSVHAPIAGFMGHVERDRKHGMATGMLDHSAGIAKVAGAEPVVFHPGFLLGRTRKQTVASVVSQLADLRKRLEGKERDVAFGVEIMGRVNDFGSLDDILGISSRLGWVRPVIDFAHLHAVTDGAFTTVKAFHDVLSAANRVLPRGAPFHIHFSDIAYANRNETKHLPYGEGTLRVEPLGKALRRFSRPATVISEAPGEESHQAIRAELFSAAGKSSARRSSSRSASSSRSRSRRN
jgi:deoxyribonuclease IV